MRKQSALLIMPLLVAAMASAACNDDGGVDESGTETETGDGDGDPGDGDGAPGDGDGAPGDGDGAPGDGDGAPAEECGNGVVEGDEACDDGNADNTDDCLDTCAAASCGDGFVWADNEACDDGNADNTDDCLDSCAAASCGDGFVWAGNEECDPADPELVDVCDVDGCFVTTLLFEDFEGDVADWTHEAQMIADTWNVSQEQAFSGQNSYHSGDSPESEGLLRLMSPDIDLSAYTDTDVITLDFYQWYRYDDCGDPNFLADGHIIEVSVDGGPFTQITPDGDYPYVLEDVCGNPLASLPAWSQNSGDTFEQATADLSMYVGSTIKIAWTVGADCGNCNVQAMLYLDDVSVTRSKI